MSGIYIPDVGLPQDRDFELWIAVKKDRTFSYNVSGGWHNGDRVAIPVPDHGRLIDADKFYEDVTESAIMTDDFKEAFAIWLETQETVIPAEPPKEDE